MPWEKKQTSVGELARAIFKVGSGDAELLEGACTKEKRDSRKSIHIINTHLFFFTPPPYKFLVCSNIKVSISSLTNSVVKIPAFISIRFLSAKTHLELAL